MTTTNHNHCNDEGQKRLAEACLHEAKRRGREDLAGDFYCKAAHESRNGRRATYSANQVAWQAAGHVLQDMQRGAKKEPVTIGGDATVPLVRTDRGACSVRAIEFAYDLYAAIDVRLASDRMLTALAVRSMITGKPLKTARLPMPRPNYRRGPISLRARVLCAA